MKQSTFIKIKDLIISFITSTIGVGTLIVNIYVNQHVDFKNHVVIEFISSAIMVISLVFAVLPAIPIILLSLVGIDIKLHGRGIQVEMEIWLWVYCIIFYTIFMYFVMQYVRKQRNKTNAAAVKA